MIIQAFPSGPFATNAYIVACPITRKAAIIDPAPGSFPALSSFIEKNQLIPDKILLTHTHWDHIGDASLIKEKYTIPIYVHELDKENLELPGSDGLPCWISIKGIKADHLLKEGDIVPVGEVQFKVIHTPGHTPGGVCLYSDKEKVLLSGDTLFQGTIGNISFPTARPHLMWDSLAKLAKLPKETLVYPGHGPSTTIGEEDWLPNAKRIFGN